MEKIVNISMHALVYLAFVCVGVAMAMLNSYNLGGTTPGAWLGFAWALVGVVALLYFIEHRWGKPSIKSASGDALDAS